MLGSWTHMLVLLAKMGIIFMPSNFECNPRVIVLKYHTRLKNWNNIVQSLLFSCPILKFTANSSSPRSERLYYVAPPKTLIKTESESQWISDRKRSQRWPCFTSKNLRTRHESSLYKVIQQLEPRSSNFPQASWISKWEKECPYLWVWLETEQKKNGKVIKHVWSPAIFLARKQIKQGEKRRELG